MIGGVLTIAETEIFSALWPDYWTDEEFGEFCLWLALNPNAGDVIAGSGGSQGTLVSSRSR
jgi:hypothetical protein